VTIFYVTIVVFSTICVRLNLVHPQKGRKLCEKVLEFLNGLEKWRDRTTEMDALVASLKTYDASVESDEDAHDVAALHYRITFSFPENTVVTIGIILMDHQTDSDVVIETMTTLPALRRRTGFGSKAIAKVLQWAADHGLKDVRATQVAGRDNESFWRKNGFIRQKEPNPLNDFVYQIPEKPA